MLTEPASLKVSSPCSFTPPFHLFSLGVYYAWGIPVPIPNTEVKPRRAYGTAILMVEESVNAKIEVMKARVAQLDRAAAF